MTLRMLSKISMSSSVVTTADFSFEVSIIMSSLSQLPDKWDMQHLIAAGTMIPCYRNNCVLPSCENTVHFEVIVRDLEQTKHLLFVRDTIIYGVFTFGDG